MSIKRLSSIESLRIVSILMIIMMHIMGNAYHTDNMINYNLLFIINTIGNTGVTMFILISGYFGIHPTISKFLKMMAVIWFYSILSYFIGVFYLGDSITLQGIEKAIFPILSRKYWFMTCYMVLFCFAPFLNRIITSLSRRDYTKLLILMFILFVISPTILKFEIMQDGGKGVINFLLAYLIGQYIKVYGFPDIIVKRSTFILTTSLAIIFLINYLLSWAKGGAMLPLARDNSFFIIIAAVTIFYKFLNYKFESSIINYMAGFVFPIYMLQDICLRIFSPYFRSNSEQDIFIIYLLAGTAIIIIITLAIEFVRRLLFDKLVNRACAIAENKFGKNLL